MTVITIVSRSRSSLLILVALLASLFTPSDIEAGRYRQPAYVTNAYFTNRIIKSEDRIKPDAIINVIRADYQDTHGYMVLDLVADKGNHKFSIDLMDNASKVFEKHDFPPAVADKNNFVISLNLHYGGNLPDGGIFFRVNDQFESRGKTVIGTFRILSDKWQ